MLSATASESDCVSVAVIALDILSDKEMLSTTADPTFFCIESAV